ncbi:MAG: CpaF family protein [Candidatus Eiseniibacteriota bacterium]
MGLRERITRRPETSGATLGQASPLQAEVRAQDTYHELKQTIHRQLIDRLDLASLENVENEFLQQQVDRVVRALLKEQDLRLSPTDEERLVKEIRDETFGLGPIEPLLHDPEISDILVNTYRQVFVERRGKLELTNVTFRDDQHLRVIIDRIVSRVGRRVDEASPYVDARLPDGSRVNAIIPPLALDGPILSIRRFAVKALTMQDFINYGTVSEPMALVLQGIVRARLNVLISGGTGSGKTTTLNILSGYIPPDERIVTIEDSAELQLQQPHVVRLETRPPNIEGKGQVTARDLVRNSLRMRPDRIVVGEVRSEEVLDMLQAMNTGHDGSLTTLHANSSRDALTRLETLMQMSGISLPDKAMREQVSSAINVIVQVSRLSDGRRKIMSVSEITGMEGNVVTMQDVFVFKRTGIGENGQVLGQFTSTGIRPRFLDKLRLSGVDLPPSTFD